MDNQKILFIGGTAAISISLLVAIIARKPSAFVLGLCGGAIFFILKRIIEEDRVPRTFADKRKRPRNKEEEEEKEMPLGAGSSSSPDGGVARMHTESIKKVDPSLYPIPHRVKERSFWEDPMDDRMRWHVSGNNGPYTAWRGMNGVW